MKIKIVNSKDEIEGTNNEKYIHTTFRPSDKDFFNIILLNPHIKLIQIPKSHFKTISKDMKQLLKMKKIALLAGNVWGHRSDIEEYIEIDVGEIKSLKYQGQEIEEIERITGIDAGIVKLILEEKNV